MTRINKQLLWQGLALVVLLLITYLAEADKIRPPSKKQRGRAGTKKCKQPEEPQCKDCILVKVEKKTGGAQLPVHGVRDIENRSIVPWTYQKLVDNNRIPHTIFNVTCSSTCKGFGRELNAVSINREIQVLKKTNEMYSLEKLTVTVGCTCVEPEDAQSTS